jgi:hypothetical protein
VLVVVASKAVASRKHVSDGSEVGSLSMTFKTPLLKAQQDQSSFLPGDCHRVQRIQVKNGVIFLLPTEEPFVHSALQVAKLLRRRRSSANPFHLPLRHSIAEYEENLSVQPSRFANLRDYRANSGIT